MKASSPCNVYRFSQSPLIASASRLARIDDEDSARTFSSPTSPATVATHTRGPPGRDGGESQVRVTPSMADATVRPQVTPTHEAWDKSDTNSGATSPPK